MGAQGVAPRLVGCRDAPRSLDHGRSFDAGNDLHLPATGFADLDIYLEHALQTLRLRLIAAWRSAGGHPRSPLDADRDGPGSLARAEDGWGRQLLFMAPW